MNIEFVKQGNAYVAEFKVEADFNLHIERDKNGHITLYQRTSEGGKYALLEEFGYQDGKTVYESDAAGLIYPKFIKVVSAVMPTYAVVTSAGEVTEIKSQTKEIEVTANGTTEVTPDAGFAYLNSVKVKTNVATSGEGSASTMEYWDVSANSGILSEVALFFLLLKSTSDYGTDILSIYNLTTKNITILAVALDRSMPLCIEGTLMSCGEWLDAMQLADFAQFGWKQITEEEFYTL